ncbi:hypothetical protein DKX38_002116 [Salix brachista]|uniref:Uncharacterized protein n=1 Tax=Salix brachista TaxID=2182728 RepID=A0A5N5NNJ7_9ROSI|nr:hypothetical protein DKX38_002116 [Salix brachista]
MAAQLTDDQIFEFKEALSLLATISSLISPFDPYAKNLQNRSERSCGGLLAASTGPFAAGNIIPWLIHESGLPTFD